jgi:hypothetical protein
MKPKSAALAAVLAQVSVAAKEGSQMLATEVFSLLHASGSAARSIGFSNNGRALFIDAFRPQRAESDRTAIS